MSDPGDDAPRKASPGIEERARFGYNCTIQVQAGSRKRLA